MSVNISETDKIAISDNVFMVYPVEELEDLRGIYKLTGVQEDINTKFNIAKSTIARVATSGKGKTGVVSKLREYVKAYKLATA